MKSNFPNPFLWLSSQHVKRTLLILGIITAILFFIMGIIDQPLKTADAPQGIISFELAKDFNQSQTILNSWDFHSKIYAGFSLGIDYLFLVAYSLFFSLLIVRISLLFVQRQTWFANLGILLAWAQFFAGIFDAIENYGLIRLLLGSQNESLSVLAYYFAVLKFLLISLGFLYLVMGIIGLVVYKFSFSGFKNKGV